jgi:hypothetical protein
VFVVWAAFFALWTFSTLLALNVRAVSRQGLTVDAEQVVMIVMYASFVSSSTSLHLTGVTDQDYFQYSLWLCFRRTSCSLARIRRQLSTSLRITRKIARTPCWMKCTLAVRSGSCSPFFLFPPSPMQFFLRIELYWVKCSGRRGKRDKRGTQSMDVLGARLTCGGLAPCARTGNRSSDRVRGHGSVSLSPICSSPLPSTPYLYRSHCVSRRN